MEVPCSECDLKFRDIRSLNTHFKVVHQCMCKYTCKIENCSRSYHIYQSFRSHLILVHHVPIFAAPILLQVVSQNDVREWELMSRHVDQDEDSQTGASQIPINNNVNYTDLLAQQENFIVAKFYANPSFPRNPVNSLVAEFSNYLTSPFLKKLEQVVNQSLDPNLSPQVKREIYGMFNVLHHPFAHLQTEYKRFQHFKSCGAYIEPISFEIYRREEVVRSNGTLTLGMKPVLGQYIPLDILLGKFFELPHVLEDTLAYMELLKKDSDWFCNLVRCEVWKRKVSKFSDEDIVIPLNVYYDEVEPNNALGPHCEPLGCTYVQVAVLPPECSARLENIFLAVLFDADNRSLYGNENSFKPLIRGLVSLETEGITVEVPSLGSFHLYFVVAFIIGDNKGLNGVCGFVESFTANHYCRICSKEEARFMFVEDVSFLRTPENYEDDVMRNDSSATGIKEKCVFGQLPSFVTPIDICVDEFHDLIEGVAHYTMIPVLKHFHSLNNLFINTLNNRLYCLDLGIDGDNKPALINLNRLLHKDKLKMTGSEMITIIRIFGVLVYDMVPENDSYYQLYLLLSDITSMLQAKVLPKNSANILSLLVKEHNELYVQLTKEHLKPKHHFLVHYPRLLEIMGPYNLLSTVRFEAKHHLLRMTANTCSSRVNLSRTVAIKQQLGFSYRCVSNSSIRQDFECSPYHPIDLTELDAYASFSLTLPPGIFNEPMQNVVNWITYKGTTYKPKQVLLFDVDNFGLFKFAEIELIIVHERKPLFICSLLETLGYFSEVRGYEVEHMTGIVNWFSIDPSSLLDYNPLCIYKMSSGENVVILKYAI